MLCRNITDLSLVLQFKINLLLNQFHGHLFSTFSKPTKEVSHFESTNGLQWVGALSRAKNGTSPGAGVAGQEDPGELCQDDQEGGNGVSNAPLQNKV